MQQIELVRKAFLVAIEYEINRALPPERDLFMLMMGHLRETKGLQKGFEFGSGVF